ncbi:MAG TPA: FkbM family methyltransferase [Aggregatilineaceae bacterium]|nr:FkbM family methyltransferase [Aggregatilineaceae bacterium]
MKRYYSQHGEDFLLWQLFKDQAAPGYFVEVGALDGTRFSNTYSFEREGWTGICVEAHPDYIPLIKRNRPNSICVWAAAGDHDGEITFYTNSRGSLSTLDPSMEGFFRQNYGRYFTGFKPVQVPIKTLNTILSEANAPSAIDIVSIDVEGAEMLVLQGFDLTHYSPRVLVIEALDTDFEQNLDAHLQNHGYQRARTFGGNIFYCRSLADMDILAKASLKGYTLTHTTHPLDKKNVRHQGQQLLNWLISRLRLVSRFKKQARTIPAPFDLGFHGDQFLLDCLAKILPACSAMIETGSNVGTTARYTAKTYPHLKLYSCEADPEAFKAAQKNILPYPNAHLYHQSSPDFLSWVHAEFPELDSSLNFYFLDAHGYGFVWPLKDEIRFITTHLERAIILVDDARVPNQPQFQYSAYEGQVCELEHFVNALAPGKRYTIIYPTYHEHTSPHHPLVGYMLLAFGTPVTDQLLQADNFSTQVLEI